MVENLVICEEDGSHYLGHRARLKKRFLNSKFGELPDYEILELLLFNIYPRRDVKPLAKKLLSQYKNIGSLLSVASLRLQKENNLSENAIIAFRLVREIAARIARDEIETRPILSSWSALLNYCRITMGHETTEKFRILYLNHRNMVIADELQETGTVNHTPVYPREIAKKALLHDASAVILVHNHPASSAKPSKADIEVTRKIASILAHLEIDLHDHIIISSKEYYSFRANGLL